MEYLDTAPLIWFIIGFAFMLLEFVLPGLIVLFFGIGAWITALLTYLFDFNFNLQLLTFIVTSVLALLLLRKYFKKIFVGKDDAIDDELEEYLGKTAIAAVSFSRGKPGKVIFKGASWNAVSESDIKEGDQVKITNRESLKLTVEPINKS